MKAFVRSILITGTLAIFTSSSMVAQTGNGWFEHWYRAKYGHPSPTEQARLEAMPVGSTSPEATPPPLVFSDGAPTSLGNTPLDNSHLDTLITAAKTPAEHQRIAQSYRDQAQIYLAQSSEHAAMVSAYRANPNINAKNQAATVGHCEYFAAKFKDLAVKSQELATMHEQMAKEVDKK